MTPARVHPPCARIEVGNQRFTFHRVSEPGRSYLPVFRLDPVRRAG